MNAHEVMKRSYIQSDIQKHLFIIGLVDLIFGLLFIINPNLSLDIVVNVSAVLLLVLGCLQLFSFVRAEESDRATGNNLGISLVCLFFGIFLFTKTIQIEEILSIVLLILLFYQAGIHLQLTIMRFRSKEDYWWAHLLISLVAMGFGIIRPMMEKQLIISGIVLVILALLNALSILTIGNKKEDEEERSWGDSLESAKEKEDSASQSREKDKFISGFREDNPEDTAPIRVIRDSKHDEN